MEASRSTDGLVQIDSGESKTPCQPKGLHLGYFASNISYQFSVFCPFETYSSDC